MKLRIILAAAAALASVAPAHAASSSSATLGPLAVTLIDLDPLDGIAASVSFDVNTYYYYTGSSVSANVGDTSTYVYDSQYAYGLTAFEPLSTSAAVAHGTASASVSGTGVADGSVLSASGWTGGTMTVVPYSSYGYYNASASAPNYYYSGFKLSANTLMLVSATSSLSTEVTATRDPSVGYGWENAQASVQMSLSGPAASGSPSGSQSSYDSATLAISSTYVYNPGCTYGYCYGGASAADARTLGVSFVNASGADMFGYFQTYASVNGYSYAQAVPEPETYAMMLAGLLSIGFFARGRRDA